MNLLILRDLGSLILLFNNRICVFSLKILHLKKSTPFFVKLIIKGNIGRTKKKLEELSD